MKALLFIFLFLICQEPVKVKQDTVKVVPKIDMSKEYKNLNIKLDSIIATKNAEYRYNCKDSLK
jgi:hypothetical protein